MPFTPFHFGPGAAIKAVIPAHFSFTVFCYSQVVTDLETGFHILRGEFPLHRFFHTYLGATFVGLFAPLQAGHSARSLFEFGRLGLRDVSLGGLCSLLAQISWSIAFVSALLGTYSHVVLDSIMHRDVAPSLPAYGRSILCSIYWHRFPTSDVLRTGCDLGVLVIALRTVTDDRSA